MRTELKEVLMWQHSVLERMDQLVPRARASSATELTAEALDEADGKLEAFRHFIEASVAKLTLMTE